MSWLLYPWERTPAPNEEAGWAAKPGWTYEKREKSLNPAGIRIPYHPVHRLVNIAVKGGCSSKAVGTTYQITVSHLSKPQIIHKTAQVSRLSVLAQTSQWENSEWPGGRLLLLTQHYAWPKHLTFRILLEAIPSHKCYINTGSFLKGYILIITWTLKKKKTKKSIHKQSFYYWISNT